MTKATTTQTEEAGATTENIATRSGLQLVIEKRSMEQQVDVLLRARTQKRCVLHWGMRGRNETAWKTLPQASWPSGTKAAGASAMQTPFQKQNGESRIAIALNPAQAELIEFALFFPEENRWDNNGRRNYQITIPGPGRSGLSPLAVLKGQIGPGEILFERTFELGASQLAVGVAKEDKKYRVLLVSDLSGPLAWHWGIARRSPHEWLQAPESLRPPGTILREGHTTQTPFEEGNGLNRLELAFAETDAPLGIQFVLKHGPEQRWLKNNGDNFYIPVHTRLPQAAPLKASELAEFSKRIIQAEMGPGSWTLMHRFNLCYDLLGSAGGNIEAVALLYVWLRFSAIRQLTWQRNYNTKPRELTHAQDRLTERLADSYRSEPGIRPFLRLMIATIGRGGDGQRIRDEILQIMHRHHIKEVSGHFTEEWHQKLHNNTTPDDIVICEAYLEYLRSDGNLERYYHVLREGGVTPERLQSFERPIRTNPDFVPHLKNALIHDFGDFLKTLKAVHSGTDLETAIHGAREKLDGDTQALLWEVWNHRNDPPQALAWLVQQITEVRRRLSRLLQGGQQLRPLLYLDLALEQLTRVMVERNLHERLGIEQLVALIGCVLENVTLSHEEPELAACSRHWERLMRTAPEERGSVGWSLHAKSVLDRIGRALADWTDRFYQLLQPKAEFLGQSFKAETWTITLFSEEVVRGSSLGFVLSMLLRQIERPLRQAANLGAWQIISRGHGIGEVEVVEVLRTVQGRRFHQPTIVISDKVMGDEEIPEAVVAVIAPDVTDLVSHVAVRARNAQVLFASCSDTNVFQQLKSMRGRSLQIEATAAGDVVFKEAPGTGSIETSSPQRTPKLTLVRPRFSKFAIDSSEFNAESVGGKSCSQVRLAGKLPEWVHQPPSGALPFGVFEQVLSWDQNKQVAERYNVLVKQLGGEPDSDVPRQLRDCVLGLSASENFINALREAFGTAGIAWPKDWAATWHCIKQVWASKWNERAVLSRNRTGIKHQDLFMAVLIQPVIEADYAFVIHTANPSSGNADELYAEIVLGLGETLVGNFPGRALSFIWDKSNGQARLLSLPSKSVALYGIGLIFRSDSNGEDLGGFAGAGLYDSVLLSPPRQRLIDYSEEPLIWDEAFRHNLLETVAKIGLAIESALGSAQDIEGAIARNQFYVVQSRPQVGVASHE